MPIILKVLRRSTFCLGLSEKNSIARATGGLLHHSIVIFLDKAISMKRIYDWVMGWRLGLKHCGGLRASPSVESSVFPIPPDILLIPLVLANRRKAWLYALVATVSSVIGGWLGYAIGSYLYESFGRAVIDFYHLQAGFQAFQEKFNEYGGWIVLIKGMTPIPYKLVTIAAGVVHLDPWIFTLASIGSRAVRFFLVAGLLWQFGEPIRGFIERRSDVGDYQFRHRVGGRVSRSQASVRGYGTTIDFRNYLGGMLDCFGKRVGCPVRFWHTAV